MKAIRFVRYGDASGLVPDELDRPAAGPHDLLVRVRFATVTAGDTEIRRLAVPRWLRLPFRLYAGFSRPKRIPVLGMELAGVVAAVGSDVLGYQPGDEVFATTGFRFGAYAEYAVVADDGILARVPDGVDPADAAALPIGGGEALSFVRRAEVREGDEVLVYGGSGSIGTYAIQLCRMRGARVTAVGGADALELMGSLGAVRTIDYATDEFKRDAAAYDVIIDAVGKSDFAACRRKLRRDGRYVLANPRLWQMLAGLFRGRRNGTRVIVAASETNAADLVELAGMASSGELVTVIDRRYPLDEVAQAHRYVDTGRKIGNVIVEVAPKTEE